VCGGSGCAKTFKGPSPEHPILLAGVRPKESKWLLRGAWVRVASTIFPCWRCLITKTHSTPKSPNPIMFFCKLGPIRITFSESIFRILLFYVFRIRSFFFKSPNPDISVRVDSGKNKGVIKLGLSVSAFLVFDQFLIVLSLLPKPSPILAVVTPRRGVSGCCGACAPPRGARVVVVKNF
jgi:hypothetical protein